MSIATVMGLSAPHVGGYNKLKLMIRLEHFLYYAARGDVTMFPSPQSENKTI